jgi:nucleoid DNA-binding protein
MTMTELVSRVAKKANVTRKVAAAMVKSLTAAIHESLKKVGAIRIAGLGTFRAVEKKARSGVHPRTREKINIPAVKSPRFLASKALKDAVKEGEQAELALDVSDEVERLCRGGEALAGFDMAMKSLIQARRIFGNDDPRTAGCMVTVADAARHREKYYLAGQMYRKALVIQERALGPSHPDVVRCKTCLSDLERDHGQ